MQQPAFINGHYYHIYNRGVEKREVFMHNGDRFRFVHDMFEFNDRDATLDLLRRFSRDEKKVSVKKDGFQPEGKTRKLLVDIVAWVLMSNHYHLLIRQRTEQGISLFMKKLGTGYTLYFNKRHERSGVLFQGTFRAKPVQDENYLRHLVSYIHLNPLGDMGKEDKRPVSSVSQALKSLGDYRWSSYLDYMGKKNFPSLLNFELIYDLGLPMREKQTISLWDWIHRPEKHKAKLLVSDTLLD